MLRSFRDLYRSGVNATIGIVGAGLAGLYLANHLHALGAEVILYSDVDEHSVLSRPAPPSTTLWHPARELLREVGMDLAGVLGAREIRELRTRGGTPDTPVMDLRAALSGPAVAVDPRLITRHGLARFRSSGGRVEIGAMTPEQLDRVASLHDITVVAAGNAALAGIFPVHAEKTVFKEPARRLTQFYTLPTADDTHWRHAAQLFNVFGAGEIVRIPFYAHGIGRAYTVLIEAVPGGPLDLRRASGPAAFEAFQEVLAHFGEWVREPLSQLRLARPDAFLRGAVAQLVKHPTALLSGGRVVLGIGDAVSVLDPLVAQGGNTALRHAAVLARSLAASGGRCDAAWLSAVVARMEGITAAAHAMSTLFLQPPSADFQQVLQAAAQSERGAQDLLGAFEDPALLTPWAYDTAAAQARAASWTTDGAVLAASTTRR